MFHSGRVLLPLVGPLQFCPLCEVPPWLLRHHALPDVQVVVIAQLPPMSLALAIVAAIQVLVAPAHVRLVHWHARDRSLAILLATIAHVKVARLDVAHGVAIPVPTEIELALLRTPVPMPHLGHEGAPIAVNFAVDEHRVVREAGADVLVDGLAAFGLHLAIMDRLLRRGTHHGSALLLVFALLATLLLGGGVQYLPPIADIAPERLGQVFTLEPSFVPHVKVPDGLLGVAVLHELLPFPHVEVIDAFVVRRPTVC
mmetsp:Transcript_84781/g.213941  ORF Transcript_84781/g.213941 Transcript_84781/m.213941 type:complete len:256 (-) Transcript_84781:1452-2219(-)